MGPSSGRGHIHDPNANPTHSVSWDFEPKQQYLLKEEEYLYYITSDNHTKIRRGHIHDHKAALWLALLSS